MVPKEQLARISGLNQALQGVNMIATPPLGALLLSLLPIRSILGIDVVTALAAICLLLSIPIPQRPTQQVRPLSETIGQDMLAGFAFLKNWPALIKILVIAALLNLVLMPAFTLVPILITQHFHGSAIQLGWINAAYGLGIITGGALLGIWGGFKRRIHTSLLGLVGLGIGCFIIGSTPPEAYWFAVVGMALVGIMNALANGPFFAVLQSIVPNEMQGRVFTVLMGVSMAAAPIGLVLAGPLADNFGVQFWYMLSALLCAAIVVWIILSPEILHLEERQMNVVVETPSELETNVVQL